MHHVFPKFVFLLAAFSLAFNSTGSSPQFFQQASSNYEKQSFFSLPQAFAQDLIEDEWDTSILGKDSKKILAEARSFLYLRTLPQAKDKYEVLLRRHPDNPYILYELAEVYTRIGDFYKGKKTYEKAAYLRPFDLKYRLGWVRALENSGHRDMAIEELKKMLDEDPEFSDARKELAEYLSWSQQWGDSVEVFDQVLAENPDDVEALLKKAQVTMWSGNIKEAIVLFEAVVVKDPTNTEALKELAIVYSDMQAWSKSTIAYEKLLAANPDDPKILEDLGNAYFFDQKYQSAEKVYDQLLESNPEASRRVSSKFSQINIALAPTLAHSFLFYMERNRQGPERAIPDRIRAASVYNTIEYAHPISAMFKIFASIASRHDDTHKTTSATYGLGLQTRINEKWVHRVNLTWEPKNLKSNPRWGLRNVLTWNPRDRWQISMIHQYTTFWDPNKSRNRANSLGMSFSRYFLKEYDLLMTYRFNYDIINDPSDFFVSIENTDGNLTLITNGFSMEKYWTLGSKFTLTTGSSYDVTDEGRNTLSFYGSIGVQIIDGIYLNGGTSWSRDNRDIETNSASSYISYRF